ncbi:hypothetical protein BDQ94DRAFT_148634 [Aspergillus welwitschiae]|uniref:Uncharacterized protein n=1 Tax=Aspergillus welwitschiae TaxID=1341132 RepID=A0A3F3PUB3_9EURO|nr:hypothetical protein BDQ94DRAFT_148634 [Aspergillus welwitschiae]RDH30527.1 hypothetical protein BDQ94DRAFT_148634 [Aspergillus welwitschiae]
MGRGAVLLTSSTRFPSISNASNSGATLFRPESARGERLVRYKHLASYTSVSLHRSNHRDSSLPPRPKRQSICRRWPPGKK